MVSTSVTLAARLIRLFLTTLRQVVPSSVPQWARAATYKIRFASLPNILVGDELVPAILGLKPRPADILTELERLLDDPAEMEFQHDGFRRIRAGMERGAPEAPLTDAADRVLAHLPQPLRMST